MTDRELMQQALDALKHLCLYSMAIEGYDREKVQPPINALKKRLAQPEPKNKALTHEELKAHNQKILDEFYKENAALYEPEPPEWCKNIRQCSVRCDNCPEPMADTEELGEIVPADEEQLKRIAKLVEPEPVAWRFWGYPTLAGEEKGWVYSDEWNPYYPKMGAQPLYTAPPQRKWQSLTDSERNKIFDCYGYGPIDVVAMCRAIEAKLKEKNG